MTMLAVIGWTRFGKRCMKQSFDSVVEFANNAKAVFWIESASNVEHARFAIDPVPKAGIATLALEAGNAAVGMNACNFTLYSARKVVWCCVCCNIVKPVTA